MRKEELNIDFTIYSDRFQEWIGTEWVLEKFKKNIYKTDEYNRELSIRDFDEELISLIVDDYIKEINNEVDENFWTSFEGGLLISYGEARLGYTCCNDFSSNLREWRQVLLDQNLSWTDIWVGHPWIYYKIEEGFIVFSDYTEEENLIKELFRVEFDVFKFDLQKMLKEVEVFIENMKDYIKERYPDQVDYYLSKIIGLGG